MMRFYRDKLELKVARASTSELSPRALKPSGATTSNLETDSSRTNTKQDSWLTPFSVDLLGFERREHR